MAEPSAHAEPSPHVAPPRRSRVTLLITSAWLIFLVFPVVAVWQSGAGTGRIALGLAGVAAFAVVYVAAFTSPSVEAGFPWAPGEGRRRGVPHTVGVAYLAALMLSASAVIPAAGVAGTSSFLPFFACLAAAMWPPAVGVTFGALLTATAATAALLTDARGALFPALIVIPVVASMLAVRVGTGLGEREHLLRRQLAVADERDRLGRDLHDLLGHTLTAMTIRAQVADAMLDSGRESDLDAARAEIRHLEQLSRTALGEVRQTVAGIYAADPDAELARLTESLRAAGVEVRVRGGTKLVPRAHTALAAWVLREAGTNVLRHAGASHCEVTFATDLLRVTDDGVGPDSAPGESTLDRAAPDDRPGGHPGDDDEAGRRPSGSGLRGLADRADRAGARFRAVRTGPEGGTTVEVRWGG